MEDTGKCKMKSSLANSQRLDH